MIIKLDVCIHCGTIKIDAHETEAFGRLWMRAEWSFRLVWRPLKSLVRLVAGTRDMYDLSGVQLFLAVSQVL